MIPLPPSSPDLLADRGAPTRHLRWAQAAVPLVKAALAGLADYLIRQNAPMYSFPSAESCCGPQSPHGFVLKNADGVCSLLTADGRIWEHRRGATPGLQAITATALMDNLFIGHRFVYVSFFDGQVYAGYGDCAPELLIDYLASLALAMKEPDWYRNLHDAGPAHDTAPMRTFSKEALVD